MTDELRAWLDGIGATHIVHDIARGPRRLSVDDAVWQVDVSRPDFVTVDEVAGEVHAWKSGGDRPRMVTRMHSPTRQEKPGGVHIPIRWERTS